MLRNLYNHFDRRKRWTGIYQRCISFGFNLQNNSSAQNVQKLKVTDRPTFPQIWSDVAMIELTLEKRLNLIIPFDRDSLTKLFQSKTALLVSYDNWSTFMLMILVVFTISFFANFKVDYYQNSIKSSFIDIPFDETHFIFTFFCFLYCFSGRIILFSSA